MPSVLESLVQIDYAEAAEAASTLVAENIASASVRRVVLGMSGGLDSAVVGAVCASSVDTLAMIMPDSNVTPTSETEDAMEMAKMMGLGTSIIDIAPIVEVFADCAAASGNALGNVRARVRMTLLYNYANTRDALVAGTSDRTELLIGYFTKHGDGAGDVFPISSLYKMQVRELARHLHVPEKIIQKKSAPYLSDVRAAEDEIGLRFEEIDPILHCIVDRRMSDAQVIDATGSSESTVTRVRSMYEASAHKRSPAYGGDL